MPIGSRGSPARSKARREADRARQASLASALLRIFCLAGTITYRIGDELIELGPGESAISPRGVAHHFANRHAGTARMLVTATPGRMGPEYFREMAGVIGGGGPPDLGLIKSVMNK